VAGAPVAVLILDLDNTVWDWFAMWHSGFSALLQGLVDESGVVQTTLEREIRAIHQEHGTSEYAPELLLPALGSLQDGSSREELLAKYDETVHAFHKARKESLRLYPGVLDTLLTLRDVGVLLIAYTESQAFVTTQRLLRTGLDGILDYVYSPPDHELPEDVSREELRRYDPEAYRLKLTKHSHTPPGAKKPNEAVLKAILADFNASSTSTLYVGDSRMKDIVMAQAVGVQDAWAKYGEVQNHPGYELLRRVSHWPDDDVENERIIAQEDSVVPSHVLTRGFHEIREQFTFSRWRHLTKDQLDRGLTTWQQTIEVQQHFNDLALRFVTSPSPCSSPSSAPRALCWSEEARPWPPCLFLAQ
jgi:FMN phosphatase YigB (HAD superfamily)